MDTPRHHAIPAGPFTNRPPSPPPITIPAPVLYSFNRPMKITPNYENVDPTVLSREDLDIITQNGKEQTAHDKGASWAYELRRVAQPVLDYLYLGPSSIARDRRWLRENGITMLVAARDTRMADVRLMGVHRVAEELGIEAIHIDVSGYHQLVRSFPIAINEINTHMLRVHHDQGCSDAGNQMQGDSMDSSQSGSRRGKVLVFCETGNDRSASIVAAYLMTVFGMSLVNAGQFIHFKRFCVNLDDELKHVLKNYEDILLAQRTVHRHELAATSHTAAGSDPPDPADSLKKSKRNFNETIDVDMDGANASQNPYAFDHGRYHDRPLFAPYKDHQPESTQNKPDAA